MKNVKSPNALDSQTLRRALNQMIGEEIVLLEYEQLLLAEHEELFVQMLLAGSPCLTAKTQEKLVRSGQPEVFDALLDNPMVVLTDHAQLLLVDQVLRMRELDDDELSEFTGVDITMLEEAGQHYLLEHPKCSMSDRRELFTFGASTAVQVRAGRGLSVLEQVSDILSYPSRHEETLWRVVDINTCPEEALGEVLRTRDLGRAPEGALEKLEDRSSGPVNRALIGNETYTLKGSIPVQDLRASRRGRIFLEQHAPTERSTWDALLGSWNGTLDDLLVVCCELGSSSAA